MKPVWIELGLQTIHPSTASWIRRGFSLEDFHPSVINLKKRKIPVVAHVILGFPGETRDMMLDTVDYVGHLPVFGIKLHLLHILKHTDLAAQYKARPFALPGLSEYAGLLTECIRILPENITIHRLTGDGPKNLLLAPLWSADKKRVLNTIHKTLKETDSYQGKGGIIWQSQIQSTELPY